MPRFAGPPPCQPRTTAFVAGWLSLLALAACFDPHPPRGAPCSDTSPCPSGQACVAQVCGGPQGGATDAGADAPVDALPIAVDRDRDQVPNDQDNCPDVLNPDQGDEDGDRTGDRCDPCPIDVNNTTDPDGDGVAGSCDPRPTMAGDAIVAFDGFHSDLPDTWELVGTPSRRGDELVLTTVATNHSAALPPVRSIANGTITASIIVDATVGEDDSATTVMLPYDPQADQGMFCELYSPSAQAPGGRTVSLWDSIPGEELGTRGFAWSTGTPYRLALTRNGNNYVCSATANGGTPQTVSGMTGSMPGQPKVGIGVYGANAQVAWLLVVSSP